MITLDEYKNYLLNAYKYKIDSQTEKVNERQMILKKKYPDIFLNKVINDSYIFIKEIFDCETLKYGYCDFEIDDDTCFGINLNITGGGDSDRLYKVSNNKIISEYILENVFGKAFFIELRCNEIERECEEDVLSFDYHYSLYMQGFPNNLDEIKEGVFGKGKILTNKNIK